MSGAEGELVDLFKRAVADVTGREFPDVTAETAIFDLGLDSITIAGVVARIEDVAHISLPDADLAGIRTVGDLTALVRRVASAR